MQAAVLNASTYSSFNEIIEKYSRSNWYYIFLPVKSLQVQFFNKLFTYVEEMKFIRTEDMCLNLSFKNVSTKQQLYGHLPPITKTMKIRWNRYAEH